MFLRVIAARERLSSALSRSRRPEQVERTARSRTAATAERSNEPAVGAARRDGHLSLWVVHPCATVLSHPLDHGQLSLVNIVARPAQVSRRYKLSLGRPPKTGCASGLTLSRQNLRSDIVRGPTCL